MAPAGRQGHPKATIGTPKGDIVDHNRTTPSMEEDRIYLRSTKNKFYGATWKSLAHSILHLGSPGNSGISLTGPANRSQRRGVGCLGKLKRLRGQPLHSTPLMIFFELFGQSHLLLLLSQFAFPEPVKRFNRSNGDHCDECCTGVCCKYRSRIATAR